MHGTGSATFPNGHVYTGTFVRGAMHGMGTIDFAYGEMKSYTGEWKDGNMHGKGTLLYRNGDMYEGEVAENNKHGTGKMLFSNGDIYTGSWKVNLQDGKGVLKYNSGDSYYGSWTRGTRTGYGIFRYSDCDSIFAGEWKTNALGAFSSSDNSVVNSKSNIKVNTNTYTAGPEGCPSPSNDATEASAINNSKGGVTAECVVSLKEISACIPPSFSCPISYEIMNDPVIAADGQTYERKNISTWLTNSNKSPKTNEVLKSKVLQPNYALRASIEEFHDLLLQLRLSKKNE